MRSVQNFDQSRECLSFNSSIKYNCNSEWQFTYFSIIPNIKTLFFFFKLKNCSFDTFFFKIFVFLGIVSLNCLRLIKQFIRIICCRGTSVLFFFICWIHTTDFQQMFQLNLYLLKRLLVLLNLAHFSAFKLYGNKRNDLIWHMQTILCICQFKIKAFS